MNILSQNFVFVNLSRPSEKDVVFASQRCSRFFLPFTFPSVISTTAPFFVKRKPLAFFFSSFAGKLTSLGSRRRRHDAPHRVLNALVQIPVVKYRKTKTDKRKCLSVISIGETGICSCLLQSNPCEIFLCFAKAFGLRSTLCCKQQCFAFVRQIAQPLAMSATLDFRKCKRLLLSSLAVSH